jgi:hypothetical protein
MSATAIPMFLAKWLSVVDKYMPAGFTQILALHAHHIDGFDETNRYGMDGWMDEVGDSVGIVLVMLRI